jgi:hypothetical protein
MFVWERRSRNHSQNQKEQELHMATYQLDATLERAVATQCFTKYYLQIWIIWLLVRFCYPFGITVALRGKYEIYIYIYSVMP